MKDGLRQILGKTIRAAVVAESSDSPGHQVFLIFTDDTYFEFYGDQFNCSSGIDLGGLHKVRDYVSRFPKAKITAEYPQAE